MVASPVLCVCSERVLFLWGARVTARHSPAVAYPLRRSPWMQWWWRGATALTALVLCCWVYAGAGWGWAQYGRAVLAIAVALICWGVAWRVHRRRPQGVLHFNGVHWSWEAGLNLVAYQGRAQVLLELQTLLVVRLERAQQGHHYWVLERESSPSQWLDLRRAVYSSAYPLQSPPMHEPR